MACNHAGCKINFPCHVMIWLKWLDGALMDVWFVGAAAGACGYMYIPLAKIAPAAALWCSGNLHCLFFPVLVRNFFWKVCKLFFLGKTTPPHRGAHLVKNSIAIAEK